MSPKALGLMSTMRRGSESNMRRLRSPESKLTVPKSGASNVCPGGDPRFSILPNSEAEQQDQGQQARSKNIGQDVGLRHKKERDRNQRPQDAGQSRGGLVHAEDFSLLCRIAAKRDQCLRGRRQKSEARDR